MKNKLELSKYIACICEGGAETAIMDILLSHDLLIFQKKIFLKRKFFVAEKQLILKNNI